MEIFSTLATMQHIYQATERYIPISFLCADHYGAQNTLEIYRKTCSIATFSEKLGKHLLLIQSVHHISSCAARLIDRTLHVGRRLAQMRVK